MDVCSLLNRRGLIYGRYGVVDGMEHKIVVHIFHRCCLGFDENKA